MRIKIFTVHHFMPTQWVANDLFVPFVNGLASSHPEVMSDDKGDNIGHIPSHGDMRTQYYVWKNLLTKYDYVGFQQYRRYYFFDKVEPVAREPFCMALRRHILKNPGRYLTNISPDLFDSYLERLRNYDETEIDGIKKFISNYDILTTYPFATPMAQQYLASHREADWDVFVRLVSKHPRFARHPENLALDINLLNTCNMYIMQASEFDDYMKFWCDFMGEFTQLVKPIEDIYQMRVYVYIAERLFTLYYYQQKMERPSLRTTEIPAFVCDARRDSV